jgi:hypothetical protein
MRRVYLGPYDEQSRPLGEERKRSYFFNFFLFLIFLLSLSFFSPTALHNHVRGILMNPNCEYEANFVPFRTFANWANAPDTSSVSGSFTATNLRNAIAEWLPLFDGPKQHPFSGADLELLVDWHHLPHRHGTKAAEFVRRLKQLLQSEDQRRSEKWKAELKALLAVAKQVRRREREKRRETDDLSLSLSLSLCR